MKWSKRNIMQVIIMSFRISFHTNKYYIKGYTCSINLKMSIGKYSITDSVERVVIVYTIEHTYCTIDSLNTNTKFKNLDWASHLNFVM